MSLHAFDKIPRSPDQSNESGSRVLWDIMGDFGRAYAGVIGGNIEDSVPKANVVKDSQGALSHIEFSAS